MTTLSDLVNDIQSYLYGFGVERDKETALQQPINDPTALTFQVADGAQVDRGYVEIDDELIAVQASDRSTGNITIQPWGRGTQGTDAALHVVGSRVASNPRFPRSRIKQTINQCISAIYPDLWGVAVDQTNTGRAARVAYPVNAAAESIVSMSVQTLGPSQEWRPITRYRFDYLAYSGVFSSGKSVSIYEPLPPGRPIKIIYRTKFSAFSGDDDQLMSDVGLDENYRDIIDLCVESKLVAALDDPRLQLGSIESATRSQYNQPGMASQISKQLWLQYQQRVAEEKNRLLRLYPGSVVRMS